MAINQAREKKRKLAFDVLGSVSDFTKAGVLIGSLSYFDPQKVTSKSDIDLVFLVKGLSADLIQSISKRHTAFKKLSEIPAELRNDLAAGYADIFCFKSIYCGEEISVRIIPERTLSFLSTPDDPLLKGTTGYEIHRIKNGFPVNNYKNKNGHAQIITYNSRIDSNEHGKVNSIDITGAPMVEECWRRYSPKVPKNHTYCFRDSGTSYISYFGELINMQARKIKEYASGEKSPDHYYYASPLFLFYNSHLYLGYHANIFMSLPETITGDKQMIESCIDNLWKNVISKYSMESEDLQDNSEKLLKLLNYLPRSRMTAEHKMEITTRISKFLPSQKVER